MSSNSIANRLESARLALHNALAESELTAALGEFGYNQARLQEGMSLYESALMVWQDQKKQQTRQRAARLAYTQAETRASRAYMRGVKLGRALFRNDPVIYRALGLSGPRSKVFAGKVAQMRLFYTTALGTPQILATLAEYGVVESELQADSALITALESARSQREVENGAAQGATRNRRQAIAALDHWMRDFTNIARLALEEYPQRLEMLGLARS